MAWIRVGKADEFSEGKGRTLRIRSRRVAIIRYENEFYALDAVCPHTGADLGLGRVKNGRVTCLDHGWTFDLDTGCMPGTKDIAVRTFPVKTEGENVFVALPPHDEFLEQQA